MTLELFKPADEIEITCQLPVVFTLTLTLTNIEVEIVTTIYSSVTRTINWG